MLSNSEAIQTGNGHGGSPLIDELLGLTHDHPWDVAARMFCDRHGCSANSTGAGWHAFLPMPANARVLHICDGLGDDTLLLARCASNVHALVTDAAGASLLEKRLEKKQISNVEITIMTDATHFPLKNDSVDAIAVDHATAGPGMNRAGFAAATREWRRILLDSGSLFVGMANPLDRLLGLRFLRSKLVSGRAHRSLHELLKGAAHPPSRSLAGLRQAIATIGQAGFPRPTVYAPIPDEWNVQAVIPVEDAHVVRFFLDSQVRRNSVLVRWALAAANVAVGLGMAPRLVPYYYLVCEPTRQDRHG